MIKMGKMCTTEEQSLHKVMEGEWIEIKGYDYKTGEPEIFYKCPNCGCESELSYNGELNFCYNCGSKNNMRLNVDTVKESNPKPKKATKSTKTKKG